MHRDMPGMKCVNGHELPPPAPCRSPVSSSAIAPPPTSLSFSVIVLGGERLVRTAAERRLFRSECPGFVRLRLFVGLDEASGICVCVITSLSMDGGSSPSLLGTFMVGALSSMGGGAPLPSCGDESAGTAVVDAAVAVAPSVA